MHTPQISLVVAVYNKAEILRLVLAACARQSLRDFEVIVADDGSGPAVRDLVSEMKPGLPFPVIHLWHEDIGWRKNTMLNKAVVASSADYLVFIDGDCLPGRHFLMDHLNEREERRVLLGRRVEASERWARKLTYDRVVDGRFERIGLPELVDGLRGRAARLEDGIRITNPFFRRLSMRTSDKILGSNFSLFKKDLVAINGFDELYTGPGHGEDTDIQFRLSLIGVRGKSIRNLAIQYHVYHPRTMPSEDSLKRYQEVVASRIARCEMGLEKN